MSVGTRVVTVVAAALVRPDMRLLLSQRPEGKPMAGLWEFPGGKLEAGETPRAALTRELREELAIEVDPADLAPFAFASHDYSSFPVSKMVGRGAWSRRAGVSLGRARRADQLSDP